MATNANSLAVNLEQVERCYYDINSAAFAVANYQGSYMKQAAEKLSRSWYGPKATQVVNTFMKDYHASIEKVHHELGVLSDKVYAAAQNYVRACGSNYEIGTMGGPTNWWLEETAVVQEKGPNGEIGIINKVMFQEAIEIFKEARMKVDEHLDMMTKSVRNTGFIEAGTETAIVDACNRIKDKLCTALDDLTYALEKALEAKEVLEKAQQTIHGLFGK